MGGDTPDIWLRAIVSKEGGSRRGDDNLGRREQIKWFVGRVG